MDKINVSIIFLILLSFSLGVYLYPAMPEKIASHWNMYGEVDGYMPKFAGLFTMPFLSIGLFLLFLLIPRIDPLRSNIEKFRKYYNGFVLILMLFLFYIYILTIFWNTGFRFNMTTFMAPALGVLFYYCGILTENAKRNWFIGIRTPWTLSSDNVWNKTHKIGGKLFKIAGLIAVIGLFSGRYALFFVIIPVVFVAIYTIVYSYFEYQNETEKKRSG